MLFALLAGASWAQSYYPYETIPAEYESYKRVNLWPLCTVDILADEIVADTGAADDDEIQFSADSAESSEDTAILRGHVEVTRGNRRMEAKQMSINRRTDEVQAEGEVIYGDPTLAMRGKRGSLNLDTRDGRFHETDYYLPDRNAQGSAKRIEVYSRKEKTRLRNVTYSTCERDNEAWQLRTGRLDLDHEAKRGQARNVTIAHKGIPFLYFPYLSFPLTDERQSGILAPRVGLVSDNGFDLTVPYYWNMAPNRDMTFYPRYMSERGVLLGTEFRFLQNRQQGKIYGEYIPHDSQFGGDRGSIRATHRAIPIDNLFTDFLYEYVSDDDYIDDLDPDIALLSPNYLERHFFADYFGTNWQMFARVQDFQFIDKDVFSSNDQPYDRLPQLVFNGNVGRGAFGLSYGLRSELVNFNHDEDVDGLRFDIRPSVGMPLSWPAGFIKPQVSYEFTAYDLDNLEPGISRSPTRGAPIFSLDSGLVFERSIDWALEGVGALQTLEPRLYYLYVPRRNQDDIPVFDTTLVDTSYGWLFLENRFTGADRLGDANQLTTALTSRTIDSTTGRERLRLNVGQIQYFENREVTLPDLPPDSDDSSVLIAEGILHATQALYLQGNVQWDSDDFAFRRTNLDLFYDPGDNDRLFNFSYRFTKNDPAFIDRQEINQINMSLLWPINDQWRTMARWNYSLKEARNMDLFGGFEYSDCCWALRLVVRSNRPNPQNSPKNSVFAELELKGFASLGSSVTNLMEQYIRGYTRPSY